MRLLKVAMMPFCFMMRRDHFKQKLLFWPQVYFEFTLQCWFNFTKCASNIRLFKYTSLLQIHFFSSILQNNIDMKYTASSKYTCSIWSILKVYSTLERVKTCEHLVINLHENIVAHHGWTWGKRFWDLDWVLVCYIA